MLIDFQYTDKFLIVKVKGELDHHTAAQTKELIRGELSKEIAINLILDFNGLKFIDSSGVGMILGRYKEVQDLGGKMAIVGVNHTVQKIITLSGINKIMGVFSTEKQAIAHMKEEK